jgi:hypothetical protein
MPRKFRSVLPVALVLLGAVAVVTPTLAADEECPQHPQSEWMSQEAITAKAKELGYDVRGVKADDGCYQVKGYDKDGKRVQAYFDPVSGEVLMVQH